MASASVRTVVAVSATAAAVRVVNVERRRPASAQSASVRTASAVSLVASVSSTECLELVGFSF